MRRKVMAGLMVLCFGLLGLHLGANVTQAYAGGILDGKEGQVRRTYDTVLRSTALATDHDEATGETISGDPEMIVWTIATGNDHANLTGYRLKTNGTNVNVVYLNSAGTVITTDANTAVKDGTLKSFAGNNVRYVAVENKSLSEMTVYEFEVYGTYVDLTPPIAPTGVTATPGNGQVTVTWTAVSDATRYRVTLYNSGGTLITTSPDVTGTSYTVEGLTNDTEYQFDVTAYDAAGNASPKSAKVTATPIAPDTIPPSPPTNLVGTASDGTVHLTWNAVTADDLAGYYIYRNGTKVNATPISATSYTQTGLTNGTTYEYYVRSVDTSGNESSPSNTVTVTPLNVLVVQFIPNGTSIGVRVNGGRAPFMVSVAGGGSYSTSNRQSYIMGLEKNTTYTVTVEDAEGQTVTEDVYTGATTGYIPPNMPDSTSLFQRMVNSFGSAGTVALAVIGSAVALGGLIILGLWAWRLLKKWLALSK